MNAAESVPQQVIDRLDTLRDHDRGTLEVIDALTERLIGDLNLGAWVDALDSLPDPDAVPDHSPLWRSASLPARPVFPPDTIRDLETRAGAPGAAGAAAAIACYYAIIATYA